MKKTETIVEKWWSMTLLDNPADLEVAANSIDNIDIDIALSVIGSADQLQSSNARRFLTACYCIYLLQLPGKAIEIIESCLSRAEILRLEQIDSLIAEDLTIFFLEMARTISLHPFGQPGNEKVEQILLRTIRLAKNLDSDLTFRLLTKHHFQSLRGIIAW